MKKTCLGLLHSFWSSFSFNLSLFSESKRILYNCNQKDTLSLLLFFSSPSVHITSAITLLFMKTLFVWVQVKCDQYWPSRGTETYGMIQVTMLDTVELATYTVRTFALYKVRTPYVYCEYGVWLCLAAKSQLMDSRRLWWFVLKEHWSFQTCTLFLKCDDNLRCRLHRSHVWINTLVTFI